MAKYGKTYWGQQFLNALENIDYSNRLPRGRSYASNGSVRSIDIDKNKIKAKVQGSRPKPYDIDIVVPEFNESQKKELLEAIHANPSILATLLNRQLPPDLLQISKNKGIQIFPKEWKDFKMKCSCPDSAVPCKHLASVIYLIANEIDLNPFKVLELHGLDVLKELTNKGIEIESKATEKIESLDDYFTKTPVNPPNNYSTERLNELDFSLIPKFEDKFLNLLSPNPPFYDKDFKIVLLPVFRYITKSVSRHYFSHSKQMEEIEIGNCLNASLVSVQNGKEFIIELTFEEEVKRISFAQLFVIFSDTENFKISLVSDPVKVLYHFFLFAKKIIEQGAIIPQLTVFNDICRILWIPLLQDSTVKLQMDILNHFFGSLNIINEEGNKQSFLSDSEQFSLIVSSWFTTLIIEDILKRTGKIELHDTILSLFFGKPCGSGQLNKDILNAIQLWLNKIHSHKRQYIPVLEVAENYPEFNIGLQIKTNSTDKIEAPVPFHQFKKKNQNKLLSVTKDLMQL
jgi:uncharacterized Zn finger protein